METNLTQLEFLQLEIDKRIIGINSRRIFYRRYAYNTFIITALLGAITTIILGLKVNAEWAETVRISALIITSIVTLINAYNAFFNHKELWIANNRALNRFYELRFNIDFFLRSTNMDLQNIETFKSNYQEILNELNQNWDKNRGETQAQ